MVLLALVAAASCREPGAGDARSTACHTEGGSATVAYARVAGVDPNLTSLDVHAPDHPCRAPVVVWVHGGGYETGDKANEMADKVDLFNDHGWILVSVNYRLTRRGDSTSAKFPDHYHDVAQAVSWVIGHISDFGRDPERIALLGHSAGADIVSNLITNPVYLAEFDHSAIDLACAGPLDSEGFDKVAAGTADIRGLEQEWVAALGNEPNYLTATSANWLIAPGLQAPPILGVVRGSARRRSIESEFLTKLADVGIPTTRIDASSLSHHEVNSQIGAPGDKVMTGPLMSFLRTCFED